MAQPTIKTSFASGEWAPKLRGRVDIQKYHAGAALLRNFFVDYSGGGASTRQGTKFVNQCKASGARLVPFQPSTALSYVLEFGQNYVRFFSNGAPVVETAVTGGTNAAGNTFTIANTYSVGDWVFANAWGGMTNVNGNYFIVATQAVGNITVTDLNGNPVVFTGAYTSGGQLQRVYTIPSPYIASDLFPNPVLKNPGLKFVQNVNTLIITHPNYPPAILTINSATSWTLANISFNPTIPAPTGVGGGPGSNLGAGTWYYAYLVTAVDANGQESSPSVPTTVFNALLYLGTTVGKNQVAWTAVSGAVSYNVYKANPSNGSAVDVGAQYGFAGNVTNNLFNDSYPGVAPDFGITPPIVANPFVGPGVKGYTVTVNGAYTTVPNVSIAAPPSGVTATAIASLGVTAVNSIAHAGLNFDVRSNSDPNGSLLLFPNGLVLLITGTTAQGGPFWSVDSVSLVSLGSITGGNTPTNPFAPTGGTAVGLSSFGAGFGFNLTWGVTQVIPVLQGSGYGAVAPVVTFSAGAAAATAVLSAATSGNPGVPGFIQQRLALAGQQKAVQSFNFSQPGSFFNFNTSNPVQADDAISGTIISEELDDIRWLTPVPTGIIAGTGKGAWLINGGGGISTQVPITPSNVTAQPQAFNGANDIRPLKINFDILYGTNKGNYIRDLSYNLYAQTFTGSDISVYSNHLFFGFYLSDWCYAAEPLKTIWAIRNDGQMLSLAYVKEQELIGWAHHDTNGQFKAICSVIELVNGNVVDAVYVIVERIVNSQTVQYVERMADRFFAYGREDSWSVDCALQTSPSVLTSGATGGGTASFVGANTVGASITINFSVNVTWSAGNIGQVIRASGGIFTITSAPTGSQLICTVNRAASNFNPYTNTPNPDAGWTVWFPTATVTGLTQLVGQTVVGVADGVSVGPFVVSASGSVALGLTATKITLGLAYLPQLQTLPLDLGEPTVQGKRKKITGLTLRVADTLGLSAGKTFSTIQPMKDFTVGNIPTTSTGVAVVTDLVNGDGRMILDQQWDTAGSYCVQQSLPYPATILACMPEVTVGDTK